MNASRHQENAHLAAFRRVFSHFPAGEIRRGIDEIEPDFMLHDINLVLGIEHTRYFRTGNLRHQEAEQEHVIKLSRQKFEDHCPEPVHVSPVWNCSEPITKSRRTVIASALSGLMVEALAATDDREIELTHETGLTARGLHELIKVRIWRASPPEVGSHWKLSRAGYVPKVSAEDIQTIIDRKNPKPAKYIGRFNALWLLIVADGEGVSSFFQLPRGTRTHPYKSQFDRVFFFDYLTKEAIELPIGQNC